jgi:elongation factor Tu
MDLVFAFQASLVVLLPSEGGRNSPVFEGYRPQLYFGWETTTHYDGRISILDQSIIEPGKNGNTRVGVSTAFPVKIIEVDMPFELREGARTVANGIITELL